MVDCNVIGSSQSCSNDLKFLLMRLSHDITFRKVANLVAPGGPFEGHMPIYQGDNAGLYQD